MPTAATPYATTGLPLISISDPSHVVQGPAGHNYGSNVYTGPVNYARSSKSLGEHTDYAAYLFDTSRIGEHFEVNFGLRWEHSAGDFTAFNYNTTPGATFGQVASTIPQHNASNLFSYRVGGVFKPTRSVSLYVAYGNSKTPSISTVNGGCTTGTFGSGDLHQLLRCPAGEGEELRDRRQGRPAPPPASAHRRAVPQRAQQFPRRVQRSVARQYLAAGAGRPLAGRWPGAGCHRQHHPRLDDLRQLHLSQEQGAAGLSPQRCIANPTNPTDGCAHLYHAAPETGGPLQQTPKHSGSLFTTYTLPFGLQVGYGLTYQGSFAIVTDPGHKINGHYPKSDDWLTQRLFASYPVTPRAHRAGERAELRQRALLHQHPQQWLGGAGGAAVGDLQPVLQLLS